MHTINVTLGTYHVLAIAARNSMLAVNAVILLAIGAFLSLSVLFV